MVQSMLLGSAEESAGLVVPPQAQALVHIPAGWVPGPGGPRWARAMWVAPGIGVRSVRDVGPRDLQVVCDAGIYSLDAVLQERKVPGWFVFGQVFSLWDDKPAEQLEVILHVDERPVEASRTDSFGEFAFSTPAGERVGVALHGSELALVELWRRS